MSPDSCLRNPSPHAEMKLITCRAVRRRFSLINTTGWHGGSNLAAGARALRNELAHSTADIRAWQRDGPDTVVARLNAPHAVAVHLCWPCTWEL